MYIKTNNGGCWIITKAVYFFYILYWAWGLEAFPQIGGYLIPLGMMMAGLTISNYLVVEKKLEPLFPLPIKTWLAFGLSEIILSFIISYNYRVSISQVLVFVEIVIVLVCLMAISIMEGSVSFVLQINRIVYIIYAVSMMFLAEYRNGRLTLYNSNSDAMVCLAGIALTLVDIDLNKRIKTIMDFGIIVYLFYCILLTGSRKAFICASVFIIVWMFAMIRIVNLRKEIYGYGVRQFYNAVFLILTLLIIIVGIPNVSSSYAFQKILNGGDETSDGYRIIMYEEAGRFFLSRPIFGIGYGMFSQLSSLKRYSHSTYAEMLSCCGLYGTILYFMPYLYIAKNLFIKNYKKQERQKNQTKRITLCIYFIMMIILGIGMIHFYNEKFMMMFGLMIAFIEIECGKEEEQKQCVENREICSYIRN